MRAANLTARWLLPLALMAAGLALAAAATTNSLVALGIVLFAGGLLVWLEERLLGVSFEDSDRRESRRGRGRHGPLTH